MSNPKTDKDDKHPKRIEQDEPEPGTGPTPYDPTGDPPPDPPPTGGGGNG